MAGSQQRIIEAMLEHTLPLEESSAISAARVQQNTSAVNLQNIRIDEGGETE